MIGDGVYPSLLQGVSQQIVQNRLDGQLTAQNNMLSDIVTGLRRRQGVEYKQTFIANTQGSLHSLYLEAGSTGYHVYVNPVDGKLTVMDSMFAVVFEHTSPYLVATRTSSIRTVTQAGYTWFLNTEKKPVVGPLDPIRQDPSVSGWFNILTGAYSKAYRVTVKTLNFEKTYNYTTPSGSAAGDVAKSVPEFIATNLVTQMVGDTTFAERFNIYADGPYVFIKKKDTWLGDFSTVKVTVATGVTYAKASGSMIVPLAIDLPANLPIQANGVIMTVGNNPRTYAYYQWFDEEAIWREAASYDSVPLLEVMPERLKLLEGVFSYETPEFEGRVSGNEENNPYSAFLTYGITGMSSYQGRLVLLAGGYCCMSASNRPLRFMRSTVVDLRDDDPIEISAGALSSASFMYAVPFNKDLILISSSHQAVVPAGNAGITPKNAMVVLSSTEAVCTNSEPKVMGRTLMYGTSISRELFGVGEMLPSQYSNSQYSANNLTGHIPRYVSGQCRAITSNSSTSSGYFLSSVALNEVLVNEHLWSGDERVQNAWHKWSFHLPILSMHSAKGTLIMAFAQDDKVLVGVLDTRTAKFQLDGYIPSFLDLQTSVTVVDHEFELPEYLRSPECIDKLLLAHNSGELAGEPIGIASIDGSTVTTVRSFPNGSLNIGVSYSSDIVPSTALIRDKEGKPILTANTNILRYLVNVQNTGEFNVRTDIVGYDKTPATGSALLWSSAELGLGQKKAVTYGTVTVPVRAFSFDTDTTLSASGTREMNIVSIEYTLRGVNKRQRL